MEGVEEAGPEAGRDPETVAAIDGAPGAEPGRERPPGGVGAEDPEHAGEHRAGVAGWAAERGAGWEERLHARPLGIGQLGRHGAIDRRRR